MEVLRGDMSQVIADFGVAKVHSLNQCSKCKRVNYGYSYG